MPAVSKKQQRFFGYLLSNPEERKKKGISKKAAKDFAQDVKEGKIADALRKTIADMKAADRKAGLLPGGPDVVDLSVERERRRKKKIDEAVKGQDSESRREGARERAVAKKSGKIRKNTLDSKDYASQEKKSIEWHDKRTKGRYSPGQVTDVHEVAPPGWGHTKAEKEKTKPWKPKSKIGGTAAAFKRALDDGRFKGLPGSKTKKEKTADMFKLMWSMKKKGDHPHYKPGTDKKYKKYQEEDWKPEIEHIKGSDLRKKAAEKKRKEAESSLPPHLKLDVMKKAFASEEITPSPNVSKKDKGAIDKRYKGLFKKDIKGTVQGVNEGVSFKKYYDTAKKAISKKQEMPKPKKADDAGARARRLIKRKEHQSKVSVIVPPELED